MTQQPTSYKLANPLHTRYQRPSDKSEEPASRINSMVDKMEKKLSSQVKASQPRRRTSEEEASKAYYSEPKDHVYRSRAYQSAINEVHAGMPVHLEYQSKRVPESRSRGERLLDRDYTRVGRDKETSEKSNYQ